ncbi:acyl-CoA dehydrogenase [Streptomyces plumbiresistens]|uniref:acyl-CoA dehydrogenase n=1 Tax=Streptomyces plumbiresistens TaxID=511811 RepID=UPI0031EC0849
MNHYRTNVRDTEFVLRELLGRDELYDTESFDEIDAGLARTMLTEAGRFATEVLAPSFSDASREPLQFDPATHTVTVPPAFLKAFAAYLKSGWLDPELPTDISGQRIPPSLRLAVLEVMLGANPSIPMGAYVVPQVVRLLHDFGTQDQRRLAELIVDRCWMVTMVLTEPDAGSDVGAARTVAHPQADGSWYLEGVKRFITYGDHDITDNIVHVVLARPVGVAGAGGPGSKGLSLFVVPKFHVDLHSGNLGDRNGVVVTGLEHKMGLTPNPTCELTFGGDTPAVGWLLGDKHDGIRQMFEIIKAIRMLVGVKSMATLSSGYLNARDYAVERVQGRSLSGGPSAGPVAIIEHPDVRRSLMTQKAHAEGMRALILYAGSIQDRLVVSQWAGVPDRRADATHQLLLPVIKGYCSETAWRLLGQESLQVLGGSGYLRDYPLEQYVRDTKVDTLYEGTTGIQALDLFSRKILRDEGAALDALLAEVATTAAPHPPASAASDTFAVERRQLSQALQAFRVLVGLLERRWQDDKPYGRALAAQDTTRLLLAAGDLLCGWLLLRSAETAARALAAGGLTEADVSFYTGKVATGRFFVRAVLPRIAADLIAAEHTDETLLNLPNAAF